MAILMVISAIQFIGVACLMNHVILFLGPLKMKDWLLCGIKSTAVSKMNEKLCYGGCSWFIPWIVWLCWATLRGATKSQWSVTDYTATFAFIFHQQRSEDMMSYYSMLQTGQDTQKTVCCRLPHFIIIYLRRSIGKAFSWYYITAFSEPEILHKYWKSTEGCSNTNCCISYYRQITFSQSHRYCTLLCNTMRPSPILYS